MLSAIVLKWNLIVIMLYFGMKLMSWMFNSNGYEQVNFQERNIDWLKNARVKVDHM